MKHLRRSLPLILAAALQAMPFLRHLISIQTQGLAPSAWSVIFRLSTGGAALFGYHAITSASSISISPANAVSNVPYTGTITFSGHSGVSSMKCSNNCNSGWVDIVPGLTGNWTSGSKATVTGTPNKVGTFTFRITVYDASSCGSGNSWSGNTSLTVTDPNAGNSAPVWTLTPPNQVAMEGDDTILNAAASGKPTPGYYWKLGIANIPGANSSSYTLTNLTIANAGVYTVFATNSSGTASTNAYLTVVRSPSSILFHYTNYLARGSSTNLTCLVSNVTGAINKYSWYLNSTPIGVTTTNLNLSNVGNSPFLSGTYTVSVNSYLTNATSTNFLVGTGTGTSGGQGFDSYWIFGDKPAITTQPANQTNSAGNSVTFTVTATGDTTLLGGVDAFGRSLRGTNYQWFTNSVATPLAGQTNSSLTLNNLAAANAGNYFVIITNIYGAITSSVATLTVTAGGVAPVITNHPSGQIVPQGSTVQLTVTAGGSPAPTYQWRKAGNNLADGATGSGSTLSGSTGSTLTIANARTNDSGNYTVGVTNASGGVLSSAAQLLIVAPPATNQSPLIIPAAGTNFSFSFTALAGYRYLVQRSTNLGSGNWSTVTNFGPTYSDTPFSYTDSFANPSIYYRTLVTNN